MNVEEIWDFYDENLWRLPENPPEIPILELGLSDFVQKGDYCRFKSFNWVKVFNYDCFGKTVEQNLKNLPNHKFSRKIQENFVVLGPEEVVQYGDYFKDGNWIMVTNESCFGKTVEKIIQDYPNYSFGRKTEFCRPRIYFDHLLEKVNEEAS